MHELTIKWLLINPILQEEEETRALLRFLVVAAAALRLKKDSFSRFQRGASEREVMTCCQLNEAISTEQEQEKKNFKRA